jgi:hypothetical protein
MPVGQQRGLGESRLCRCHREFASPEWHWLPLRDPEPGTEVRAVVLYGDDPAFLRVVRVPGGWHGQGAAAPHPELTAPEPWAGVGRCWAGAQHPVVDATGWLLTAGRPGVAPAVVAPDVVRGHFGDEP